MAGSIEGGPRWVLFRLLARTRKMGGVGGEGRSWGYREFREKSCLGLLGVM